MSARGLRRRYDLADNIRATIHAEVIVFGTLEIGPFRGDVVMRAFEDTGSHLPIYPQGHRLSFCHSRTLAQPRRCREVNMKMPAAVSDSRRRIPRYAARCAAREQRGAFLFRAGWQGSMEWWQTGSCGIRITACGRSHHQPRRVSWKSPLSQDSSSASSQRGRL
jgi:hypothetical protein